MKKFLFWLIQWTWGLPQTLIGLIFRLCTLHKTIDCIQVEHTTAYVIQSKHFNGAVSIGPFITCFNHTDRLIMMHEYGHCIQSLILGPLWLFVVGIPSLIWAGCFDKYREKHGISYYSFYTEKWANKLIKLELE